MDARTLSTIIAAIAALVSIVAASITITFGPDGTVRVEVTPPEKGAVLTLGEKASPQEPVIVADVDNQVDVAELQEAATPDAAELGPGIHEDARDEAPPGAPADAAEQVRSSDTTGIGAPLPVGGAQRYSCPDQLVRNYSDRSGARVRGFVLHYTVSAPGSLDVIQRLFDSSSFGASSHLGLEPSGRCEQWVPWAKKAWTQGAFNSVAESVEIIARGTESRAWWLRQPILKRGILASIVADRLRARGLPPRRVNPAGCDWQQAGWTDHNALECGNTHHDVSPSFPYGVFAAQVKRAYATGNPLAATGPRCTARNVERAVARRFPDLRILVDDGIGPRTREGIRRFQRNRGLPATGLTDPKTGAGLGLSGCRA